MNFNKNKNILKLYDVDFFKYKYKHALKKLILKKKKSLGRSFGSIVSWHRGGGVKRNFRTLFLNNHCKQDFGILRSIEYDPNRTSFIGTVQFKNGAFSIIPVSSAMKVNDIISFSNVETLNPKIGDSIKLRYAPIGVPVYNLEKFPGSGAIYSRSGGVFSILLTKDANFGKIKLASGEERLFDLDCTITLGMPSNIHNKFNKKYKAGNMRLLNRRPTVRGVAMNPIDHPHGGGAGKTAPGRPSVSPWGKLTKGVPTRKKNIFNKFIIKRK